MTSKKFCDTFNSGDANARSTLYRRLNLKDADINMLIPFPENPRITAIVFAGYMKVRSAVWYLVTVDEKRIPGKAFRIRAEGKDTFDEFVKTCENEKFANLFRDKVIECFHHAITPDEWQN